MRRSASLFLSSGDLIADRRYTHAQDLANRGDLAAAADILTQTVESLPGFAAAWFLLGDLRERLEARGAAIRAYERALAADPEDRSGAGLRLARLGAADAAGAMSPAYVRTLFDQYAGDFDRALVGGLDYRGPQLLYDAVEAACRRVGHFFYFDRALDLGCGTGLAGEKFAPRIDSLVGIDLSPKMVEMARYKGCYNHLHVGDLMEFLRGQDDGSADLVLAADVFVYVAELTPVVLESVRVLDAGGFMAFSVETHTGAGSIVGPKLRYAHSIHEVRAVLASAGLAQLSLLPAPMRTEGGAPVPSLIAVAQKPSG